MFEKCSLWLGGGGGGEPLPPLFELDMAQKE